MRNREVMEHVCRSSCVAM